MAAVASLRALVAGSVDYAGLFPPASLPLEPSLRNYCAYLRDADAWMLGTFVLPIAKFEETSAQLSRLDVGRRLPISALGSKAENATEFIGALAVAAETIRNFNARQGGTAAVTQIEMALPAQPGVNVTDATETMANLNLPTFWEAAPDEAERTIAFLAERTQLTSPFGFKLRTGGVIASAFPSSIQIARALVAAAKHNVPIKFTAGLHHPVRQFHPSVQTKMHGFLNVLGAGVMAAEHEWDVQKTAAMLEEEDGTTFVFDDETFTWRDWTIPTAQIRARRALITSFGSCSFDEPREDLRALSLL